MSTTSVSIHNRIVMSFWQIPRTEIDLFSCNFQQILYCSIVAANSKQSCECVKSVLFGHIYQNSPLNCNQCFVSIVSTELWRRVWCQKLFEFKLTHWTEWKIYNGLHSIDWNTLFDVIFNLFQSESNVKWRWNCRYRWQFNWNEFISYTKICLNMIWAWMNRMICILPNRSTRTEKSSWRVQIHWIVYVNFQVNYKLSELLVCAIDSRSKILLIYLFVIDIVIATMSCDLINGNHIVYFQMRMDYWIHYFSGQAPPSRYCIVPRYVGSVWVLHEHVSPWWRTAMHVLWNISL